MFLYECVEGDEWWKGEVAGSSTVGLFPAGNCAVVVVVWGAPHIGDPDSVCEEGA